eukprot:2720810-Rhodomonas_salina.1
MSGTEIAYGQVVFLKERKGLAKFCLTSVLLALLYCRVCTSSAGLYCSSILLALLYCRVSAGHATQCSPSCTALLCVVLAALRTGTVSCVLAPAVLAQQPY